MVGSLLAIYLAKRGFKVSVYERRPDMRKSTISAGRSINLALSDRGWRGLDGVGISDEVRKIGIAMKGREIHNLDGKIAFQPYGTHGQANYSVSRGGLNCLLMDLAEKHGAQLFFNERCTHIDLTSATATLENNETKKTTQESADRIFGTDGAFSAARLALQIGTDRFSYSQSYLDHGYKELTIPPAKGGEFALDHHNLHIWPRGQFMLIALPNLDRSFTCTLFFPFEGENSFAALDTKEKMLAFFNKMFADAVPLMPTLVEDYFRAPPASLATIRCFPWSYKDKLLLMGDAAHGIVPFFGQGMNCGFEDCIVLEELMNKHREDWNAVFRAFENSRKPDGDAIAELATENYIEMRDKVGDARFLLQKKIEARFSEKHPEKWTPLYVMVTYRTDLRYSEAQERGQRQEAIMQQIMAMPGIEQKWDSDEVENAILKLLKA